MQATQPVGAGWVILANLLLLALFPRPLLAGLDSDRPPRTIKVEAMDWDELSDTEVSPVGRQALDMDESKWKHAETENYILHFRRFTEARKVARELEFNLWFVARTLKAERDAYRQKGHAYIFEDEEEWQEFLTSQGWPLWSSSLAAGDELFLSLRRKRGNERFKSGTLAHEATHAVVARLYPRTRWPLWLNEGLAEYMSAAGVAARKNQSLRRHLQELPFANLDPDELTSLTVYPTTELGVVHFYQSAERLIRYLMTELPEEKFPLFVEKILQGSPFAEALLAVYGEDVKDYESFLKDYAKFKT